MVKRVSIQTIIHFPIHVETYILNQKFTPRSWTIKKAKNVLAFEELKTKNTLEIVHEELIEKFN